MNVPNNPDDRHEQRDDGTQSVQSRGGIGHEVASAAEAAGGDRGTIAGAATGPGRRLDQSGDAPHDGRAHHGLHGDDSEDHSVDTGALPASSSTSPAADLGRASDRRHGPSDDPAERTTGGDRPNDGGRMTGAPGGPSATVPKDLPGDDENLADDVDRAARGGIDATRDPQI